MQQPLAPFVYPDFTQELGCTLDVGVRLEPLEATSEPPHRVRTGWLDLTAVVGCSVLEAGTTIPPGMKFCGECAARLAS